MRMLLTILFAFSFSCTFAQDFERVDALVLKYPKRFSTTTDLSNLINRDFKTDSNKARAIYTWMINNISYSYRDTLAYENIEYDNLKEYYSIVAKMTIQKGHGVCSGYARLFKLLCDEVGVRCGVVTGYGKNRVEDIGREYSSNHAWNKVLINKQFYLVDITWGAGGFLKGSKKFIPEPKYLYFMTRPWIFLRNHYPDNVADMLKKNVISKSEYINLPIYYSNRSSTLIKVVEPKTGILSAGQKIQLRLNFKENLGSLSYQLDDNFMVDIDWKDEGLYKTFTIDLTKVKKAKELRLFANYKSAIVGFKIIGE